VKTPIYIDSCAWNYLHDNCIDLVKELPSDQYAIYMTREVEIEIDSIPDEAKSGGVDKRSLKNYIQRNVSRLPVSTTCIFGFETMEPDDTPSKTQVYGGFNVGTFESKEDQAFYASPEIKKQLLGKSKAGSGLGKNEADASLAVRARDAVVLTNERPEKAGPLKSAAKRGDKVVYLAAQVEPSGLSLGQFLATMLDT